MQNIRVFGFSLFVLGWDFLEIDFEMRIQCKQFIWEEVLGSIIGGEQE